MKRDARSTVRSVGVLGALALATTVAVSVATSHAADAVTAAPSVTSAGSTAAASWAGSAAALPRLKRGLKVTVTHPLGASAKPKVVVKGPKGWKRTITKTTRWKRAKPGAYRVTAKKLLVDGTSAKRSLAPERGTVRVRTSGAKRGAQVRVTFRDPHDCTGVGDGVVYGVGANESGQIGDGTKVAVRDSPFPSGGWGDPPMGLVAVAGGSTSGYALCSDGTVLAWGDNADGRLGIGTLRQSLLPIRVHALRDVKAVAAGDGQAYALREDGTVWAWGRNDRGQLGDGSTVARHAPVRVQGLAGVTAIAAGHDSGYALLTDGTVRAWGGDASGQLGDGGALDPNGRSTSPVTVANLTGVTALAAGQGTAYALRSDSTVRAWGAGADGALGNGTDTSSAEPVTVTGLTGVTSLGAGRSTGYAVRAGGVVSSWGSDVEGALGDGGPIGTGGRNTAADVPGLTGVAHVVSHGRSAYALGVDGTLARWGEGTVAQLNYGARTSSATPISGPGILAKDVAPGRIAAGARTFYVIRPYTGPPS